MSRLYWFVFYLCVAFSTGELLGPESRKVKGQFDDDESDSLEKSDPNAKVGVEYLKKLSDAVQKELATLQNAAEALKDRIDKNEEEIEDSVNELLKKPSKMSEMRMEHMKYALHLLKKHTYTHQDTKDEEGGLQKSQDESKEIFGNLQDPVTEVEPELTPDLKEAKQIYDAAVEKLDRRPADLRGATMQVKLAAERGYHPAKIRLAWSYIFGEGVELDIEKAKDIFEALANEGIADAHAGMGFLYATGLGVTVSQARALVHYTFGMLGGSDYAQMALAYRYWAGVTVPSSCPKAMELYMKVATKVASKVKMSGGTAVHRVRLMDEAESSGGALDSDLIDYYQLLADKGDVQAQVGLGQLHFQGGRGVNLDISKALHYFKQAAKTGNAVANAFLGKIYLEGGDGVKPDNETALHYFKKAAELNNAVGQSGLGIMYLQGRGVPRDTAAALKYFTMAANQGWVEGQLHLGLMYFRGIGVRRDFKQANKFFSLASQSGHVLAFYHLALMHAQGLGVLRSCSTAVELLKNVCERGSWSGRLMLAHAAWRASDMDSALAQYLAVAERGFELAQSNAAYLLDIGEARLFPSEQRWARALQLWARAAAQGSAGARVKLGDYHYYGLGTAVDLEAAAYHYRVASEQLHSAQATFNLGYMHERGLGLARDPHLAKRCYDLAADTAPEARLPAALALARLHAAAAAQRLADALPRAPLRLPLQLPLQLPADWDACLIALLSLALGLIVLLRRPRPN
ncbi:unnamed protein product, partial [Iphiclides podalirius]